MTERTHTQQWCGGWSPTGDILSHSRLLKKNASYHVSERERKRWEKRNRETRIVNIRREITKKIVERQEEKKSCERRKKKGKKRESKKANKNKQHDTENVLHIIVHLLAWQFSNEGRREKNLCSVHWFVDVCRNFFFISIVLSVLLWISLFIMSTIVLLLWST